MSVRITFRTNETSLQQFSFVANICTTNKLKLFKKTEEKRERELTFIQCELFLPLMFIKHARRDVDTMLTGNYSR